VGIKLTARLRRYVPAILAIMILPQQAAALERIRLFVSGGNEELREDLQASSLVVESRVEGRTAPADIFAAALADYARLLDTLYANGYYSGVIHILIDGREAAEFPLLRAPRQITEVAISVTPGPPFVFGQARIAPLAPGTELPEGFRPGALAAAPVVREAVETAVDRWREVGYAKVRTASEDVAANHNTRPATLDTVIGLAPGRVVYFGDLVIPTPSAVRARAIRRIAGLPTGERFSPEAARLAAQRLRRTGAFSSVSLTEAEVVEPDGEMDMILEVVDQKPRRFGFGAEVSSLAGLEVTGFWMHRNIFGGAERLRFDAEVSNIGSGESGTDYRLNGRLETPAPFGPLTRAFAYAGIEHLDEPTYLTDQVKLGFGAGRTFGEHSDAEISVQYLFSETEDAFGKRRFSLLSFPFEGEFDNRDDPLDATEGYFLGTELTPFVALNGTGGTGVRAYADARAYYGFGAEDRVVLAGRLQFGSISGAPLAQVHPDFLFYSGGAGTVRGQPYKSLDVDLANGRMTGGRSFVGLSGEIRTRVTERIGAVLFADAGYIGAEQFYDGTGEWHAGAGIGARYLTGIGPIRLDVALPVSGNTGDGVQLYLGIGQAF
jgi:translocation and assembly module TamA